MSPTVYPRGKGSVSSSPQRSQHLDLWEDARLLGLLNLALADGYVGSWDTKYHDNYWRPVTAIREAATDGNPRTTADPTWTPLVTTPPIPDYDSAHAVEGGAAAAVLARVLGRRVSFTACSVTVPVGGGDSPNPVLRHFDSFSEAAAENAVSRIYVGIHFRHAVETGTRHGDRIGRAGSGTSCDRLDPRVAEDLRTSAYQPLLAAIERKKDTAMIVLIGIAVILLLLLVLRPAEHLPSSRSTDPDDTRAAHDLQLLR